MLTATVEEVSHSSKGAHHGVGRQYAETVCLQVDHQEYHTQKYAESMCHALQSMMAPNMVMTEPGSLRRLQGTASGSIEDSVDIAFVCFCSIFVFLMQAGFAMVRHTVLRTVRSCSWCSPSDVASKD